MSRRLVACAVLLCVGVIGARPDRRAQLPVLPRALPSGYFRVENLNGTWWLIDPAGSPGLSIGVDNIAYEGDRIRGTGSSPYLEAAAKMYRDRQAWEGKVLERLWHWGFNSLGAWSDHESWDRDTPHVVMLDFAARAGADWLRGTPVDVFDPHFEAAARAIAREEAAPRIQDRMLVGYFSDNELWWGPDWRRRVTLLGAYLALSSGAPGRQEAVAFLRSRYGGSIHRLNRAWHVRARDFSGLPPKARTPAYQADADAFLELVAARYFAVSRDAIHASDPHHLYLGARFAGLPPDPVLRASRVVDVVSLNLYDRDPRRAVRHAYATTGRPVLISEFSFRALDSGLPNTIGAGPWVFNERTRGRAYANYVTRLTTLPEVIGYHWFRWADEPREGRSDGENSNYGLVDVRDTPYREFLDAVAATNHAAVAIHLGMMSSLPTDYLWHRWSFQDIPDLILGGPRWLSTVVRAVQAFLQRRLLAARAHQPAP